MSAEPVNLRQYFVDGLLESTYEGLCPIETYSRQPLKCTGTYDAVG